ncbi:MAG TPA: alanine racemase [Nitrospirota bacterium]|nr:alanine racemase [Nitrospirota bacterium]
MKAQYTECSSPCGRTGTAPADRPTAARIDLGALEQNFTRVKRSVGNRKILAVVKAGAYGHGAVAVSRCLLSQGADMLGVALVEEGEELRSAGIEAPILVMGPLFPEQAVRAADLQLTPVVFSMPFAQALDRAAARRNSRLAVHVKIDTGMGRIGIPPEDAVAFISSLHTLPHIEVQGLMTHFADADLRDKAYATSQMERFCAVIKRLEERGVSIPLRHAANSAAVLDFNQALFTMVRPGLMLYGYDPVENVVAREGLQPVLSLVTRIAFLKRVPPGVPISYGRTFVTQRDSVIATLPIGYADGFSRKLSNKGEVLVRGQRVPVVGRVCMDMCMIDVTEVRGVSEGDEAVLIGRQGDERITADEIAAKTDTISYEVLCGIGSRVPRIYQ